jgi:hypothetical protein
MQIYGKKAQQSYLPDKKNKKSNGSDNFFETQSVDNFRNISRQNAAYRS